MSKFSPLAPSALAELSRIHLWWRTRQKNAFFELMRLRHLGHLHVHGAFHAAIDVDESQESRIETFARKKISTSAALIIAIVTGPVKRTLFLYKANQIICLHDKELEKVGLRVHLSFICTFNEQCIPLNIAHLLFGRTRVHVHCMC